MTPLQQEQKLHPFILIASLLLIVIGLFWNLGLAPLYLEEPRRALVAIEMLLRDNWIVPTQAGDYYYRKPPVFNWLIIGGFKLFGNYSEWSIRFFSIISHLATGGLVYWIGRKYVHREFGILTGVLTVLSVDIFYFFSIVGGEIDLFYGLISFALFIAIYRYYEQQKIYTLFIIVYLLGALGALTKGLPSFAFLGISLLVFFSYKKDFWKLFHPAHFIGLGLFFGILGLYFYTYHQYHSLEEYLANLWSQSADRTLKSGSWTFLKHIIAYPLETVFKNTMPATLLIIFLWHKKFRQLIFSNPFITFCTYMLISNFALYWISQGAKQRYLYMLYPFIVMICTYAYLKFEKQKDWRLQFLKILAYAILGVGFLGFWAIPFIPQFEFITYRWWIPIGLSVPLLGIFYFRKQIPAIWMIVLLLAIGRIAFDLTILPVKAHKEIIAERKQDAINVHEIVGDRMVKWFDHYDESAMSMTFYLTSYRSEIVNITNDKLSADYFIARPEFIREPFEVVYEFKGNDLVLFQFPD